MSGQCYSCGANFGVFKKEHGCKNCGYSFCKDCLTKKVAIPKLGNEKHKVCNRCLQILTGKVKPSAKEAAFEPPDTYYKRLAALEQKKGDQGGDPKGTKVATPVDNMKKYRGLSKEDMAIAERLEKLKESHKKESKPVPSQKDMEQRLKQLKKPDKPPPSQEEMTARLAKLKGEDPNANQSSSLPKPDKRTPQEQVDDLFDQISEEVKIDSHRPDPTQDVARRLAALRGEKTPDTTVPGGQQNSQGNLENNLNKATDGASKNYKKNIATGDRDNSTENVDNLDLEEVNKLLKDMADQTEGEALSEVELLKQQKEIWDHLHSKDKKSNKNDKNQEDVNAESKKKKGKPAENQKTEDVASDSKVSGEENDDEAAQKVIQQLLEEARLEEQEMEDEITLSNTRNAPNPPSENKKQKLEDDTCESDPDSDELPWCCICNEDATLRCRGCDNDLYCQRCFREGHDKFDWTDHQTVPYKQKAKPR